MPAWADEIPNSSLKRDLSAYAAITPASEKKSLFDFETPGPRQLPDEDWLDYRLRYIPAYEIGPYGFDQFTDQADSIKWGIVLTFVGTTVQGVTAWDWGSTSFHFNNEGWFGKDTGSLGTDKLGHAFTTYLYAEGFTQGIAHNSSDITGAAITGAILAMGVQTYVEFFDGFSNDHGFSYEDMIMNGLGAGFSVLRSTVPGLREKLDFRLEYIPSGNKSGFHPASDYSGQKYLLALKLAGFEALEETPLRFVELQAGYFARGFTDEEEEDGDKLRREPYLAVGVNLSELLLSSDEVRRSKAGKAVGRALEYIQVPYTYIATEQN